MTAVLQWVAPDAITAEDYEHVLAADDVQPVMERIPLEVIDKAIRESRMHLFRLKPGPGIVLVEVREAYGVRRLSLLRGSGRMMLTIRAVIDLLAKTAAEWGCEAIETVVYSDRLQKALELCGCQTEGYIMKFPVESADGHEE